MASEPEPEEIPPFLKGLDSDKIKLAKGVLRSNLQETEKDAMIFTLLPNRDEYLKWKQEQNVLNREQSMIEDIGKTEFGKTLTQMLNGIYLKLDILSSRINNFQSSVGKRQQKMEKSILDVQNQLSNVQNSLCSRTLSGQTPIQSICGEETSTEAEPSPNSELGGQTQGYIAQTQTNVTSPDIDSSGKRTSVNNEGMASSVDLVKRIKKEVINPRKEENNDSSADQNGGTNVTEEPADADTISSQIESPRGQLDPIGDNAAEVNTNIVFDRESVGQPKAGNIASNSEPVTSFNSPTEEPGNQLSLTNAQNGEKSAFPKPNDSSIQSKSAMSLFAMTSVGESKLSAFAKVSKTFAEYRIDRQSRGGKGEKSCSQQEKISSIKGKEQVASVEKLPIQRSNTKNRTSSSSDQSHPSPRKVSRQEDIERDFFVETGVPWMEAAESFKRDWYHRKRDEYRIRKETGERSISPENIKCPVMSSCYNPSSTSSEQFDETQPKTFENFQKYFYEKTGVYWNSVSNVERTEFWKTIAPLNKKVILNELWKARRLKEAGGSAPQAVQQPSPTASHSSSTSSSRAPRADERNENSKPKGPHVPATSAAPARMGEALPVSSVTSIPSREKSKGALPSPVHPSSSRALSPISALRMAMIKDDNAMRSNSKSSARQEAHYVTKRKRPLLRTPKRKSHSPASPSRFNRRRDRDSSDENYQTLRGRKRRHRRRSPSSDY